MTRKIILDCDPGIDDAIAITMALYDPRLEVVGITATAGTVDAERSLHNVSALVASLDPPKYPRIGSAVPSGDLAVASDDDLHGRDGLGETDPPASIPHQPTPSDRLIAELATAHPGEVTIVCLGPLTNLANVVRFEPTAVEAIDQVIISGGCISAPGNAGPSRERNMAFHPAAASVVFGSALTKRLVPLDVTEDVSFGVDLLDMIPDRHVGPGNLLHRMLSYAFRQSHERLGRELLPLYDPVTLVALTDPDWFAWETMAARVETEGGLTRGMTLFDQRLRRKWSPNMDVARGADGEMVADAVSTGLRMALTRAGGGGRS